MRVDHPNLQISRCPDFHLSSADYLLMSLSVATSPAARMPLSSALLETPIFITNLAILYWVYGGEIRPDFRMISMIIV